MPLTVRDLHTAAMEMTDYARVARMQERADSDIRSLFEAAFTLERWALDTLESTMAEDERDHQPTHGILCRSAAWLALNAGLPSNASTMAKRGLAYTRSPISADVRGELESVLKAARKARRLRRMYGASYQFSIEEIQS